MRKLSLAAAKVQNILKQLGLNSLVTEFSQSTKTSQEAAEAIGCQLGQIAKSLVFQTKSGKPILIIASGANRVDEKKIEVLLGEPVKKAAADFVYQKTGFAIGGIPPVGHREKLKTFIDQDLLQYPEIWAAAGTPRAVFKISPSDLVRITTGQVAIIKA